WAARAHPLVGLEARSPWWCDLARSKYRTLWWPSHEYVKTFYQKSELTRCSRATGVPAELTRRIRTTAAADTGGGRRGFGSTGVPRPSGSRREPPPARPSR